MLIEIVDFELEHLDQIDMRDHEASLDYDLSCLKELSTESKTAFVDGKIMSCWGIFDNHGLWQIPSKDVASAGILYARRAAKVIKDLIKDKEGVHSLCLDDDYHARWMIFNGFVRNPETVCEMEGHRYVMYEVA